MKVKDLSLEQFKALVQEAIEEKLAEMLADPDIGLELRDEVSGRLKRSLTAIQGGDKGISIDKVASQLGLKW
jgi:hypothetical protein